MSTDTLMWTSQDPRQSTMFTTQGIVYRFITEPNASGQHVTTLWKMIRSNKEDRVAKLEWAPNGGLGRAIIGKSTVPMTDLVRRDPHSPGMRLWNGPDGFIYRWAPSGEDVHLLDPNNAVIAKIKQCRPARYPGLGDVYYELEFLRSAGQGVVMHPPLMDTVTVTAMLYRFATQYNL
ncbi:unnamed protein product [Peniophora sp. CBMAI 1063]|nr:unnamed protein product [Peniophora sp. CBMAI 1063]